MKLAKNKGIGPASLRRNRSVPGGVQRAKPTSRRAKDDYFGDDLHIFAVSGEHGDLLGAKVVAIGDVPVAEAYERVTPLIARDNEYEYLRSAPIYFRIPAILHALELTPTPDEVTLTVAGTDGESQVTVRLPDEPVTEWTTALEAAGSEAVGRGQIYFPLFSPMVVRAPGRSSPS